MRVYVARKSRLDGGHSVLLCYLIERRLRSVKRVVNAGAHEGFLASTICCIFAKE